MTIDETIVILGNIPTYPDENYCLTEYQEAKTKAIASLTAWKKTEAELKAYAEKLASISIYDSRVEAVLHCLNVMRKNLEA